MVDVAVVGIVHDVCCRRLSGTTITLRIPNMRQRASKLLPVRPTNRRRSQTLVIRTHIYNHTLCVHAHGVCEEVRAMFVFARRVCASDPCSVLAAAAVIDLRSCARESHTLCVASICRCRAGALRTRTHTHTNTGAQNNALAMRVEYDAYAYYGEYTHTNTFVACACIEHPRQHVASM